MAYTDENREIILITNYLLELLVARVVETFSCKIIAQNVLIKDNRKHQESEINNDKTSY